MNIKRLREPYNESYLLSILDEQVGRWFREKYKSFTPPQRYSIAEIHKGNNILISSPTGSGKTLSAFLTIISELIGLGRKGELKDQIYCIYVSPLKALNNDIRRNLEEPLAEIEQYFSKKGLKCPKIRIGIRTGDTSQSERAKMLKKPPHILITTPESLAILLSTPRMSKNCESIRWIIVDELHALAENKRGTSLALSLERLTKKVKERTGKEPIRIGLSATVHPLEEMAKFLVGKGRACNIVDVNYEKKINLVVYSPVRDLVYAESEEICDALYSFLKKIIEEHKTTLIFTNTRSATESVSHKLKQLFKNKIEICAHHSSLSKEVRFDVEQRMKEGKVRVVVSSTSLELGIDIGSIDIVILLGSPKSVARTLQRVGRSGHKLHEVSKGVMIALDRDDLIEEMMIAKCAKERKLDRIRIIKNALDVLAQHLVGMSLEKKWHVKEAYELITSSYPYFELSWNDFTSLLEYLSGYHAFLEQKNIFGKIWYDGEWFGKRRGARMLYYTNSGTIPDESYVDVLECDGIMPKRWIGKVEEEFAERLMEGDVFVLGGKTYEYVGSMGTKIIVLPIEEKSPTVPAWFSEMLLLSYDLALMIQEFRMKEQTKTAIMKNFGLDENTAETIIRYFREQRAIHEDKKKIVVEEWLDDEGYRNYIFQFVAGRKANEAIARVLAYRIGKRLGCNVGIKLNDYGIALLVPEAVRIDETTIRDILSPENFYEDLRKAIGGTELLRRRFRHVAVRAFLVLRQYRGKAISSDRQQNNANALLSFLSEHMPSFPVLKEAYREVMQDAMHVDEAIDFIKKFGDKIEFKKVPTPSPFSFSILSEGSSDVVVVETRREFIKKLHKRFMLFLNAKSP